MIGGQGNPSRMMVISQDQDDYAVEFANAIADSCSVKLCVARDKFGDRWKFLHPGVDCERIAWPRRRSIKNLLLIGRFVRLIRSYDPDVIHVITPGAIWLNAVFLFVRGWPVLVTVHDLKLHPGDKTSARTPAWLTALLIRRAAAIIVHGPGIKRQAMAKFGLPTNRVRVIPHLALFRYVQIARARGFRRSDDGLFRVLFFGRIFGSIRDSQRKP